MSDANRDMLADRRAELIAKINEARASDALDALASEWRVTIEEIERFESAERNLLGVG